MKDETIGHATHKHLCKIAQWPDWWDEGGCAADIYGTDCSWGCIFFHPLEGRLGSDWGVCHNPESPRCGLLTFEHMGCEHFK